MRSYKGPVAGQLKLPQQFLRFARNLSYKTRRLVGRSFINYVDRTLRNFESPAPSLGPSPFVDIHDIDNYLFSKKQARQSLSGCAIGTSVSVVFSRRLGGRLAKM